MADLDKVQVITDSEKGLIILHFGTPVEWYAAGPEEMEELGSMLLDAVTRLEMGADKEAPAQTIEETDASELDDELEEYVSDLLDTLRREEKEAHGGD